MFGDDVAGRYEFGGDRVEDVLMHRLSGRRLDDGAEVFALVFQDASGVGRSEGLKLVESAMKLAGMRLAQVPAMLEAGLDEDGRVFAIFEAVGLPALKSVIRERGGLSPAEALDLVNAVCSVLKETAAAGINHLNLSSSSIFCNIGSGEPLQVRIEGFGLGGILPQYSPMKKTSPFFGVAEYMSPEVCSGRAGNASSDLYALGCLMYEMVYEKPPFVSTSASTTIKRQVYEKPLPLHLVKPGLPQLEAYEGLLNRLLAKDPTGRPAGAAEVMEEISRLRETAFFDITLAVESPRDEYPVPVSALVEEKPVEQPVVADQLAAGGGQTMAFEGLGDAVAEMIRSQEAGPAREEPAGEVVQKTEAFDASFIASVVEKAAAGAGIADAVEEAKTEIMQPVADQPADQPTGAKKSEPAAAKKTDQKKKKGADREPERRRKTRQTGDEGLSAVVLPGVERAPTGPLPSGQTISARKKTGRKGSGAVVAVVIVALAVLIAIGVAVWLKSRAAETPVPAEPAAVESTEGSPARVAAVPAVEPAPEPVRAAEPAEPAEPVAPVASADQGKPAPDQAPGSVEPATPAAPEPVAEEPSGASAPVAAVEEPETPAPAVPAARARKARRVKDEPEVRPESLKEDKPAPAPAIEKKEEARPAADPAAEAAQLRARARKAGKDGDYRTAISLLEKARSLDPANKLDDKFISAWQKKLGESAN